MNSAFLSRSGPTFAPPTPEAPVFDPADVRETARQFAPRYGDATWAFGVVSQNPSSTGDVFRWARFPDALREQFRHASWALVNFPLDDLYQARHGSAMRTRLSASRLFRTVNDWLRFAHWLDGRGIWSLGAVTAEDLVDFSHHLAKELGLARTTTTAALVGLSRLHAYTHSYLPAGHRLVEPPWVAEGLDDYLPAGSPPGENATEPITPETMGTLLIWAMRFVEVFAEDILAAKAERDRLLEAARVADLQPVTTESGAGLVAYLERLETEGLPVPSTKHGRIQPSGAATFLAGHTGTPRVKVFSVLRTDRWRDYAATHPGPVVLPGTPVLGELDGQPWHPAIQFSEVPHLLRHLVTSCFVVICYLTGMRIGEVLGLETGCCPDPGGPDDAPKRFLIYGRQFKNARDEHGNHLSAGVMREAGWVAIPQVVAAIRVLERIAGPGLLFDALTHDARQPEMRIGRSLSTSAMANRVEYFLHWVDDYVTEHGRTAEAIVREEGERLAPMRFRRTLAWHIARRPGGLVALAVQYGHMRTIVSGNYASRSRDGIHDLLDFETARTVAEHLSDVHEALQDGQGVSGPAARRLIHSAALEHERFGGMVTTVRQAKALLADPALNVFENKKAYLICNWDRSKALCETSRATKVTVPSLDRCRSTCANIARTDTHAEQMEAEARLLIAQASSPLLPSPIADRLHAKAQSLRTLAAKHREQAITTDQEAS